MAKKRFQSRRKRARFLIFDGKLYVVSRRSGVFVLAAKPVFRQLAHNQYSGDDSDFNAGPAISNGRLCLRSDRFLYCINK